MDRVFTTMRCKHLLQINTDLILTKKCKRSNLDRNPA